MGIRRQSRPGEPRHPGRHALPGRLRSLLAAHLAHGSFQRGSDQSLQPDLPGLFCQRQRGRVSLRAFLRAGHRHAGGPARAAARAQPRGAIFRRRAHALSALYGRAAQGHGARLHPHSGGHQRHQLRAISSSRKPPRKRACTLSTCNSTGSTTTFICARAASA